MPNSNPANTASDDLLKAVMLSQALNPGRLFQRLLDDITEHLMLFFRLQHNLQAARVQVGALKNRNAAIEACMKAHQQTSDHGSHLNTLR